MSRDVYMPRQEYEGDGAEIAFTFDFKVEALSQLRVLILSSTGLVLYDLTGEDTAVIDSVDFDPVEGGGTVTLLTALADTRVIVLLEANDAPTQPSVFRNHASFNLKDFEMALDYLAGAIQRLAYRALGSIRLHDAVDPTDFDTTLPANIAACANKVIAVNDDGDGLELVENAAGSSSSQLDSAILEGQAATDVDGVSLDSALYSSGIYQYEIQRGADVFSMGKFSLHYRDGAWYLVLWSDNRDDVAHLHGVTFTLTGTTTAQLQAAVATDGEGDGSLKIQRLARFTA